MINTQKKGEFIKINKGKVLLYYVINKKIKIPDVVVGEDYKNVKKVREYGIYKYSSI